MVDYAKEELKRIGMIDSGNSYNDAVTKAILDLIKLFASQGHTGFTAPYTINAFKRLAMFKPLTPLTGEDSEWNKLKSGQYQNKRYCAVFKDKDGKAYNSEGKIFTDDGGETWYGSKDSFVEITFPYTVPDNPEKVYLNKAENEEKNAVAEVIEVFNNPAKHIGLYNGELTYSAKLVKAFETAIRFIEAWNKVKEDISETILYYKDWSQVEFKAQHMEEAFEEALKIINKHLAEVKE